jgi:uncharacterized protein (DUF1778 family)
MRREKNLKNNEKQILIKSTKENHEKIKVAASLSGLSMKDFVLDSVLKNAEKVLKK